MFLSVRGKPSLPSQRRFAPSFTSPTNSFRICVAKRKDHCWRIMLSTIMVCQEMKLSYGWTVPQ